MAWLDAWTAFFDSAVRMRGRSDQQEGKVQREATGNGELARAVVQDEPVQTVTLHHSDDGVEPECTCAAFASGQLCRHVYAMLVELSEHPGGRDQEHVRIESLTPRTLKARRRRSSETRRQPRESLWVGRLTMLTPTTQTPVVTTPLWQRQMCYLLLPEASEQQGAMVLELRQRLPTRQGWGKPKALRLSAAELAEWPDPLDRQLIALVLGGSRVDPDLGMSWRRGDAMSQSVFRLPPGAWRALLYRLAQSGRCCLGMADDAGPALEWDGPDPDSAEDSPATEATGAEGWTLWLRGEEAAPGLVVHLELRRGSRTMPIDQPSLVLGGPDGLVVYGNRVAPLDDRGAMVWINQFRDARRTRGRSQPLEIPQAEVPAFLDRLYTLPQLPEIDLPDAYGREERWLRPQPCLDVHRISGGTGESGVRKQMLARVWFAYGDRRIRPTEPGRFVTEAAPAAQPDHGDQYDEAEIRDELEFVESSGVSSDDNDAAVLPAVPLTHASRPGEAAILIRRDPAVERRAMSLLLRMGLRPLPSVGGDCFAVTPRQLPRVVSQLLLTGWAVYADAKAVRNASAPRLTVRTGIDWFELRGSVTFESDQGVQEVALPRLLTALREGQTMIQLDDGSHGLLPRQWLEEHGLLTSVATVQGDHLRFRQSQAALLDALLRQQELLQVDSGFELARQRLRQFDGIEALDPSPCFHGQLRPYQREGLGWMQFLRHFAMGGILADDMGLGKTVQVLAMLDRLQQGTGDAPDGVADRPSLIVAPRSVVFNWVDEAARFAPRLRVLTYSGTDRQALRQSFDRHDLIVTTYGLMRRDIEDLARIDFDYVVLDEAQVIKNPGSQAAKAARLLRATHRLALTGTPIENHLGDLWSIFEFLNPGMLGSGTRFARLVRGETTPTDENGENAGSRRRQSASPLLTLDGDSGQDTQASSVAAQVAQALRPFVLRRTKKQVLKDLPEKTEQTIVCEMEGDQRRMYDELRAHYRQTLLGDRAGGDAGAALGGGQAFMVLEALLRMRQAACHPGLIDPKLAGGSSAKLEALIESLTELIDEGHKALVFSQFVEMLSIVRKRLDQQGVVYEYLDGQTRDRKRRVRRFQEDPDCPVFLISLKAGGLGLNLTAAEYVFILDPWWNPAVEQQAIDRTHRIGQTRPVFAYRLICQDTVEQRIIELQNRKRVLAEAIVGGDQSVLRNLTRADLDELLR